MLDQVVASLQARGHDLLQAIRVRSVQLGVVGTALMALGHLSPAYLPQASPYWPTMRALGLDTWAARALATALVIGAVALLILAWYRLRPDARRDGEGGVYTDVKHWAVLAWWSLPLLLAPPIFSHDAYSYAAQGWLVHNGLNPYEVSPSVLPGAFADQVAWLWRYTPAPYGPLSLAISHWMVDLAGFNPYYSALAQRIPALVGVALIVHFLPRVALLSGADARRTAWFSTINPLLVVDLVGGAHNDALMLGLIVLALYLALTGWFWIALAVAGVAMAVKQPALLVAIPIAVIGSGWASWRLPDVLRFLPRLLVSLAVVLGVFALVSVATGLGFGWLNAVSVPGSIVTMAPFSLLGFLAQQVLVVLGQDGPAAVVRPTLQTIGTAVAGVLMAYQGVRFGRTRPLTFLCTAYLTFAVLGPALYSWYLLWGLLFLPLATSNPRLLRFAAAATSVLLVYGAVNLAWRNDAVSLALAALATAGVLLSSRRGAGTVETAT